MNRAELLEACFGQPAFPPSDETFEVVRDSDVLSHVAAYHKRVVVGGRSIEVWGIAQVCTDPAWRRLGFATCLLSAAHKAGLERNLQFAVLFSDDEGFYGKIGYQRQGDEAPRSEASLPGPLLLVKPLMSIGWPDGPVSTGLIW